MMDETQTTWDKVSSLGWTLTGWLERIAYAFCAFEAGRMFMHWSA